MAHIVVADDDGDIRDLVALKLTSMGHDVTVAGDGGAALEACRTRRPDLVLLDVMMPGVTGLEAVRRIRDDPDLAAVPVVLLTARALAADVTTGFDSGADDYVTKPFSPRELAARVEHLLARDRD